MDNKAKALRYGLVAALALFEGAILLLALQPTVSDRFRAFFIERSSDCWPLEVSGAYQLGQTVSFIDGPDNNASRKLRVCGWIGPYNVGTWSYGVESRLRIHLDRPVGDLLLSLELVPYLTPTHLLQTARFSVNGQPLATLRLDAAAPPLQSLVIPGDLALTPQGNLDISIALPDSRSAFALGVGKDHRPVALRLLSLRLSPLNESSAAPTAAEPRS